MEEKVLEIFYPKMKVYSDGDKLYFLITHDDSNMRNEIKLRLNTEESQILAATMLKIVGQIEMIQRIEANKNETEQKRMGCSQ